MATAKMQTRGFKTAVYKSMGDVTDATSIIYTVYDSLNALMSMSVCECPLQEGGVRHIQKSVFKTFFKYVLCLSVYFCTL